jgi:hypothetical protein
LTRFKFLIDILGAVYGGKGVWWYVTDALRIPVFENIALMATDFVFISEEIDLLIVNFVLLNFYGLLMLNLYSIINLGVPTYLKNILIILLPGPFFIVLFRVQILISRI